MEYNAASSIIIRDEDDKVFLGKRSFNKKRAGRKWETVGGKMEKGESPRECIKREIKEELNAEVESMKYFRDYIIDEWFFKVFIVSLKTEPVPNKDDFEEWGWFSEEEIDKMDFTLNCKKRVVDYFKYKKSYIKI